MPIITLDHKNKSYEVKENEIIFFALHDQGEILPHGCLAGSCGSCRLEILKGKENLSPPGAMELNTIESILEHLEKTKGKNYIEGRTLRLACRARVLGDITIKPFR